MGQEEVLPVCQGLHPEAGPWCGGVWQDQLQVQWCKVQNLAEWNRQSGS